MWSFYFLKHILSGVITFLSFVLVRFFLPSTEWMYFVDYSEISGKKMCWSLIINTRHASLDKHTFVRASSRQIIFYPANIFNRGRGKKHFPSGRTIPILRIFQMIQSRHFQKWRKRTFFLFSGWSLCVFLFYFFF